MSIFIEKIRIGNFRSLRQISITLSPNVTLLVGANNAGKTTFLRALGLALNMDRRFINQDDLFIDKDGRPLPEAERVITIDVKIIPADNANNFDDLWAGIFGTDSTPDVQGKAVFAFRTQIEFGPLNKEAQIKRYVIRDWDKNTADENSEVSANLSCIPFHFIDAQRDLQEDIQKRTSHFGRLTGKIEYDAEQRKALEQALAKLNEDAVANSEVLSHLRKALEELNKAVHSKGKGVEITPFPKKVRDLHKGMKVHFQDGGSDAFSLEYHGMGTRSWASLLAFKAKISWEAQEKNYENEPFFPILGLEEPEAHLHPNAQRQVYRQLSEIKGQKIISTHSPYIAAWADLNEVRHFYKETDQTEIGQIAVGNLNPDELRKINREVLLSEGELLFSKFLVLFEGETEAQCLPIFAYKYFDGIYPFEKGITFISVHGTNYKPFVILAEAMKIPWFIFSDYDKPNVQKGVNNVLTFVGLDPACEYNNVIKLGKPIEVYLISESYQPQLKAGINAWYAATVEEGTDQRQIEADVSRVNGYSDEQLKDDLSGKGKVRYPSYWAEEIIKLPDDRCIPPKILKLFDAINAEIHSNKITEKTDATSI